MLLTGRGVLRIALVVLIGSIVSGGTAASESPISATPTPEISIGEDSLAFPANCTPEKAAQVVLDFIDAFNQGDQETLKSLFPAESTPSVIFDATRLSWYSVRDGPTVAEGASTRGELLAYFARRHTAGERLTLLTLKVAASRIEGSIGASYKLIREANDYPAHDYSGKAGINCELGVIHVWSMGAIPPYPEIAADATPVT